MSGSIKLMAMCLVLSLTLQMSQGSSIPIWEFLTRHQKVSYLYSTFAQLVSVHCKATASSNDLPVNQCKRDLLGYGYEKLQTFSDAQLDSLDPYQRHSSELIWSSIMRDHTSSTLITTRKPVPTPPASSIIILSHQTNAHADTSSSASTVYPQNPLFQNNAEHKHQYAMDMDMAYGYASPQALPSSTTTQHYPQTFLTGPLVVRVRPDGTPVEEDRQKPLPRDDDNLEFFQSSSTVGTEHKVEAKHRKIATINSLKQQHLSSLLQQQLQPPFEQSRLRRHYQMHSHTGGYHYGKGQA